MRFSVTNVAAAIACVWVGSVFAQKQPPVVVSEIVNVTPPVMLERIAAIHIENNGLRARVRLLESRKPQRITRTDTVVTPPDTVYSGLRVNSGGRLAIATLLAVDSTEKRRPELMEGIDVSDCDDGWSVQSGNVICDRTWGHVYLMAHLSTDPGVGAYVERTFRSPWRLSVAYKPLEGGRWDIALTRGIKVF